MHTYKDLENYIKQMSEEDKNKPVKIYDFAQDELYDGFICISTGNILNAEQLPEDTLYLSTEHISDSVQ